jgi:hypothetical protein
MSQSYRIAVPLATLVSLFFVFSAWAGSLSTSPFPGDALFSGFVHCSAVNVGNNPAELTEMALRNPSGTAIATLGPVTVEPGHQVRTDERDLSLTSSAFCTFQFKGKFKGSHVYRNGTEVEIIPATK